MTYPAKEIIKKRKSVRTFDGRSLSSEHLKLLEQHINSQSNPFGVPVAFRLLDTKEHELSSPVILGEEKYLAAKVKRVPRYEIALGYGFEEACLYALSLGIGTVMLAASLNRSAFEKAIEVGADEVMPVASPLGYPAQKKSMREKLMRKGIKADERLPFEKLFFEGDFNRPLSETNAFSEPLSMARLAPSAANKQPWRVVVIGDAVHFYEYKTMKDSALGDIQKVDIGIALAHFDLTEKENGYSGSYTERDPQIDLPENMHYIISYERTE
ncbi:MAG: nitroreductase [Ruminococcus sp.]|nr:nitroreductase [Ruminococcus sp.]